MPQSCRQKDLIYEQLDVLPTLSFRNQSLGGKYLSLVHALLDFAERAFADCFSKFEIIVTDAQMPCCRILDQA